MRHASRSMPSRAPLPMAPQDFAMAPDVQSTAPARSQSGWRWAAFGTALTLTSLLSLGITGLLARGGLTITEVVIVALVGLTFIWVCLSCVTVALGLMQRLLAPCRSRVARRTAPPQTVALLVPIYNEDPAEVFGNAAAMLQELAQGRSEDTYTLFILSDTRDAATAAQEERLFWDLQARAPLGFDVYYRRRAENTDKKVGNLADWIEGWGGAYEAMLVLDADSLMSGSAIRHLTRTLAADPSAGLIQSYPALVGAETLFGRMQQFSNTVYGWLQAEGVALWSQQEANYWGHNAIIRTRAFAQSARLPHLKGRGTRHSLILSHDFVEAGMLRRAGWSVRFEPRAGGSFEETPQTLIDYALRDRRWCMGNLQHLRLLRARGFHPMSRFHFLQGAFGFLLAPIWCALVVIWTLMGPMPEGEVRYFTDANPLHPLWPELGPESGLAYLALIYVMLLLPKIVGAAALVARPGIRRAYGGAARFGSAVLFEILCAIVYAPVLMVQQSIAVARALAGVSGGWAPQNRRGQFYSWRTCLRFHGMEMTLGLLMAYGLVAGALSIWLAPIALSLCLAPVLSWLSAVPLAGAPIAALRLESPTQLKEPRVVARAKAERARLRTLLDVDEDAAAALAAE